MRPLDRSTTSVRDTAAPWLDQLHALAQTPSRPAPVKPSPNLVQALMRLDLAAVIGFVTPLLDDPKRLTQALAPIALPPALKKSEQGYPHARLGDRLTPVGATLFPMDPPRTALYKGGAERQRADPA